MSSSSRTNIPNSLNEHWMPFTDNKSFKKNPRLITDAKGVYLTNHEGKKVAVPLGTMAEFVFTECM